MRSAIVLLALAAGMATAQDRPADWKGELVVGKKYAKDIAFGAWVNDKYESYTFRGIYPIRVRADKEGWLRVFDGYHEAWVQKSEFVQSKNAPAYFTDRIRLNPRDGFAWHMRGQGWLDREDYDNAFKDFEELIRLEPQNSRAFNGRASSRFGNHQFDKAIVDYNEAIRLDPSFAMAFSNRGLAWSRRGDLDQAIRDYDEAIRLDPKYSLPLSRRADVWITKGDLERALRDCEDALRISPTEPSAVANRALIRLLKRLPGASSGFRAYIELEGWGDVSAPLAVIHGSMAARLEQDTAAAKWFLEGAGKLKAGWPEPVVRFLSGGLDEPGLLKLATDKDKETEARTYLGFDHAIRGNRDAARAHFQWVKDNGTRSFTEYAIAVVELARLEKGETPKR